MNHGNLQRAALTVPAKLYEFGVRTRIALYESGYLDVSRLAKPVISIGNLTVGGTGKTPLVAFLARYLRDEGHEVAILSRGYGRGSRGLVEVSNTQSVLANAGDAGDEPFLLARSCPGVRVVVNNDRAAAGKWIEKERSASVFVLDDGFQHLGLGRDLNLALLDAGDLEGLSDMVPFGRLREPLTSLRRAGAIIVTRADEPFDQSALRTVIARYSQDKTPVFYAYHDLTQLRRLDALGEESSPAKFSRRKVAVVSGIGRPRRFVGDLEHLGMTIVYQRAFQDHHRYSREDFNAVVNAARDAGAEALIMTEKDAVNLPPEIPAASPLPIFAAVIEFRCEEDAALKSLVLRIAHGSRRREKGL
jgi:tetraacyldisaccharide 4'-kinase